jgi:hypothetical protein
LVLVVKALRSILLVVLGVGIGLPAGLVIGSRSAREPVKCSPGLRNLDAAIAQMEREAASKTNGSPAATNPIPTTK